jgi:hypothetical protein
MKALRVVLVLLLSALFLSAQQTQTYGAHYVKPFLGPQVYRDAKSATLFYVESDGRHVAAISNNGKLLWNKDPFTEARLSPYRTEAPQIVYVGPARDSGLSEEEKSKFIAISFNSSQRGLLRISDGEFRFRGQD